MDPIEDKVSFCSIRTLVGSLATYSASENLSPYISECEKDTEKYCLPNFYHEDKTNQFIPPFSRNEKYFSGLE